METYDMCMCIIYGRKYSLSKKLYVLLFMREAGQECEKIIFFFFIFFWGGLIKTAMVFLENENFFRGLYFLGGKV